MTRLITALDYTGPAAALAFVERLEPGSTRLKVGNELFTAAGPAFVETLQGRGFEIFLDLKYHDIPNTVAAACTRAAALGVWMVNVHAGGGRRMLEAAREAVPTYRDGAGTRLIAVTVLTSLEREDLFETGLDVDPADQVRRLLRLAREAGLDGVVCSPREIGVVREEAAGERPFLAVTPGVRPRRKGEGMEANGAGILSLGGAPDDQRRTATPREAILAGADHLVIGRAVTQASDPATALGAIADEVDRALVEIGSAVAGEAFGDGGRAGDARASDDTASGEKA